MNIVKKFLIATVAVIVTAVSAITGTSASFTGDDRIVIVLDPGHGGKDPGAAGIQSEAYYNLKVALAAKAKLEANGNFIVHMTRSTADKNLTIAERLYYADTVNADAVISIHFNSSASKSMSGIEVYGSVLDRFYLGDLAQKLSTKLAGATGLQNRGVFRKYDYGSTLYYWSEEYQWDIPDDTSVGGLSDYYGVITWGAKFGIPALIIEHAYLSNTNERQAVNNEDMLRAMGEADADAIIEYYTNHTHSYGGEIIDAPVTCFSAGKKSVHCTVCGHRKNVTTVASSPDSTKHIWLEEEGSTSATCDSDGYAKYYCRYTHNLNDKGCTQFEVHRTESVTPAYGHDYQVTYHSDVNHTVDGITTYTCTRCSSSYSETVTAEGHSFALSDHKDPDCTEDGHDTYTCSVCNESYTDTIPSPGHDFTILDSADPTCEESGMEHRVCNVCDFEEEILIPPTGHDIMIYSDVMPNCTEEGIRVTKCNTCGTMEEIISEKTGHSFTLLSETAPTCDNGGERLSQCIVCAYEETVILDPMGHDFEIISETAPTCETDGARHKKCRTCGEDAADVLAATGHSYDGGIIIKAAGLFADGKSEHRCANDSEHTVIRTVRDLTVFEYMDVHTGKFAVMCTAAAVIVAGIAVTIVVILRKRSKRRKTTADANKTTAEESAEKEPVE